VEDAADSADGWSGVENEIVEAGRAVVVEMSGADGRIVEDE